MDSTFVETLLEKKIESIESVRGGDIADAYKVTTSKQSYFVKSASYGNAYEMFMAEALGLQLISQTNTIKTPAVHKVESKGNISYLVMDFIDSKTPEQHDMERFGFTLAQLHGKSHGNYFGLETDNFIGVLPQNNNQNQDWSSFYIGERLMPQIRMAVDTGKIESTEIPSENRLQAVCKNVFGKVSPSLLHGDLWNGNYLIAKNGTPYLIDPSVYCGHNEVDLAMAKLFGGFSGIFYTAYHEVIPPHPNQEAVTSIYQLYYLLVHLNLFGTSYLGDVKKSLKRYFG